MTAKLDLQSSTSDISALYRFTQEFFHLFGANVRPLNQQSDAPLHVTLSDELADHFGERELFLCFHHEDVYDGQELVAHGSRVFDRMMAYLDRRGALTALVLPARFLAGDELLRAVRPLNAAVTGLRMREESRRLLIFNWRITYRADDKREELFTVALDEEGARLVLIGETQALGGKALDLDALMAAAEPPTASALKLPPMTQLTRWAETARKYAIYHADARCVDHEAEILPRLHKTLSRLITYYEQQIGEIYDAHDPSGEKRRGLEVDLQRKIAEEVENHRLRVRVTLVSYAVIQVPIAVADLTLTAYGCETPVRVTFDRFDGSLTRPACYACGREVSAITLDRNGHVTCEACLHQCATCGDLLCDACGVDACPVCGAENCETCSQFCWSCGERACIDHISPCPVCGDMVCHACQTECAECGVRQCRSHLRLDAVDFSRGDSRLICPTCAVRCPGCQQYTTHLGVCSASGQRFCEECLVTCSVCGRPVGPGFYERNPLTDAPVCQDCLPHCPTCGAVAFEERTCAVCGSVGCPACMATCQVGGEPLCQEHALTLEGCGHVMCESHLAKCHVGGEQVCPVCTKPCPICGDYYCAEHGAICELCGGIYCSQCVDESGVCATCAGITREGVAVEMADEPWVDDYDVARLAEDEYAWVRSENRRYIIYLGHSPFMQYAMVTVQKAPTGGQAVMARELELDDLIRVGFWRANRKDRRRDG